jgi:hypothetical protein
MLNINAWSKIYDGNAAWSSGHGPYVAYVNDSAGTVIKPKQYTWVKALD